MDDHREQPEIDLPASAWSLARPPKGEAQTAQARAAEWAEQNAEAIKDYNRRIAERGVFGADWRRW